MAYSGWTNWETWNANNWITNDPATDEHGRGLARSTEDEYEAGELLRQWYEDQAPELDTVSWFSDAISMALHTVDWRELAVRLRE